MALPAGTVTLLFSDIEGSTRLLERLGAAYNDVLDAHRAIVRAAIVEYGGCEVRTEGDAFFVAFARASDAVQAAVAAQRGLAQREWPEGAAVRIRIGVHTGEPQVVGGDYVGMDVHRAARICSAAHGGQIVVSETTQSVVAGEAVAGIDMRDLGVHRLKDLTRPLRLYQVGGVGLAADFPPLRAVQRPPTELAELQASPTLLFGRDEDLDGVARLVRAPTTRLVTLVGAGGVGKTRLALEAARRLAGDFADWARFVELAGVSDVAELPGAIARAVAAPTRNDESSEVALLRFLRDRHLLLVLDNFEQLTDGAPLIADLLGSCPDVTVIITSREPTRLGAERLYPVSPLALPTASADASAQGLAANPAVAMFCDRSRARDPSFVLDDDSAPHVGEICRRLDGLPLALELAAASTVLLAPAELSARLDNALETLVRGTRDAPERQRTLRATIDWSYRLLRDAERQGFERMAAFAGGATVAAAEAVTCASLDTLEALVAKQLLARRGGRLLMLETVREYAAEKLDRAADADETRQRLADWCLSFLDEATPHLVRADRSQWLSKLDAEYPNAVAALSWALDRGRSEAAVRLVGALGDYWWRTGRWADGRPWVDAALESGSDASPAARGRALLCRARLVGARRPEPHRADLEAALALFRAAGDASGEALCLAHLAAAGSWGGEYEDADALAQQAIRIARAAQDEDVLGFALVQYAVSAERYVDAASRTREASAHLRGLGDLRQLGYVRNVTAYLAIAEGRHEDALAWLEDGIEEAGPLGDPNLLYLLRGNQGVANLLLGRLSDASDGFRAALAVCQEAGSEDIVDESLLGMAVIAAKQGAPRLAAQLAGAASAHPALGYGPQESDVISRLREMLDRERDRHGLEDWGRAQRAGEALSVREAIDLALARGRFARIAPDALAAVAT
jgi:predicted ATPase/class 3 adenylate cyclase